MKDKRMSTSFAKILRLVLGDLMPGKDAFDPTNTDEYGLGFFAAISITSTSFLL